MPGFSAQNRGQPGADVAGTAVGTGRQRGTVLHRRPQLRAEASLPDSVARSGSPDVRRPTDRARPPPEELPQSLDKPGLPDEMQRVGAVVEPPRNLRSRRSPGPPFPRRCRRAPRSPADAGPRPARANAGRCTSKMASTSAFEVCMMPSLENSPRVRLTTCGRRSSSGQQATGRHRPAGFAWE